MTNASASFYYHLDPLGTATDVTDASGAAQWKYEYEAYGGELSATNVSGSAPENRLRFNGQYLDAETGLYHLRARQYDPSIGRFGGLDPVEISSTSPYEGTYVYASGRPTTLIDPLGTTATDDPPKHKRTAEVAAAAQATFRWGTPEIRTLTASNIASWKAGGLRTYEEQRTASEAILAADSGDRNAEFWTSIGVGAIWGTACYHGGVSLVKKVRAFRLAGWLPRDPRLFVALAGLGCFAASVHTTWEYLTDH